MPIICGGTNYYIESLVWKVLIDQELSGGTKRKLEDNQSEKGQFLDFDDSKSSEDLYARLKEVDPERSKELMPSQRRKIVRSLQGLDWTLLRGAFSKRTVELGEKIRTFPRNFSCDAYLGFSVESNGAQAQ